MKNYIKPEITIHELENSTSIMHGSGDNPYWHDDHNGEKGNPYWHDDHNGEKGNPYWNGDPWHK